MNSLMNPQNGGLVNLSEAELNADLNFDPAAVIDGDTTNDLNVSFILNFISSCDLCHRRQSFWIVYKLTMFTLRDKRLDRKHEIEFLFTIQYL